SWSSTRPDSSAMAITLPDGEKAKTGVPRHGPKRWRAPVGNGSAPAANVMLISVMRIGIGRQGTADLGKTACGLLLGHHRLGDVHVSVNLLHIVVIFQRVDELQHALAVIDIDVLRHLRNLRHFR